MSEYEQYLRACGIVEIVILVVCAVGGMSAVLSM